MTYTIKTRGAGGLMVAEYLCPEHGRFDATVERDVNGDPPPERTCPVQDMFEEPDDERACAYPSPWVISAPAQQVWSKPAYATVRGGDMKERPPNMLDTRPLAEGMTMTEWKKVQREKQRERRHKQMIDRGLIQKKVIVG